MNKIIILLTLVVTVFVAGSAFAGFYHAPEPSPVLMHVAGYLKIGPDMAEPGDEIAVYAGGKLVGSAIVEKRGLFGDLCVSGDFAGTPDVEGAFEGEPLEVRVWQKTTAREFCGLNVKLIPRREGVAVYVPYEGNELRFEAGMFYFVAIEGVE